MCCSARRLSTNAYAQYSLESAESSLAIRRQWRVLEQRRGLIQLTSMDADNPVSKVNTHPQNDSSKDRSILCRFARQQTISAHAEMAVLVSCKGAKLTTVKTYSKVVERGCSMTARSLRDILPGRLFYPYILDMRAKLTILRKFTIVANAAGVWTIHRPGRKQWSPHVDRWVFDTDAMWPI